ncbi:3-deoxy-D-manno-octulosonic acid transferase [Agaribacter flavus]|uniref:3-deoxy-D-manno-octulosonic acid transferase n=1 Tax=Agaribacter flavus TaxID=1902781 RepID=A0ABV7FWX4_9ALTE
MNQAVSLSVSHHFWRYLYTFILLLLLPFYLALNFKKLRAGDTNKLSANRSFLERFGRLPDGADSASVLFHCVSVGEVNAAAKLIQRILEEYPEHKILLTTSSVTGAYHAQQVFSDKVIHGFLPMDIPLVMNRFIARIPLKLVCITEVEIWPNMLNACWKKNIPVCLLNARMSDNSLSTYKRLSKVFRPALRKFSYIFAQNQSSYENFLSLGLFKSQVRLSKNMKFDVKKEVEDDAKAQCLRKYFVLENKKVLVCASSHDPEEKMLLSCFSSLKTTHPELALIVVPRHPHRFDEVFELCKASGWRTSRYTSHSDRHGMLSSGTEADILLLDVMGWLKAAYAAGDYAFIGGSFADKGGHNALECAVYCKPMLMGPSIFNNPTICQQLAQYGALSIVDSQEALDETLATWIDNPNTAFTAGKSSQQVLQSNTGAVDDTLAVLSELL